MHRTDQSPQTTTNCHCGPHEACEACWPQMIHFATTTQWSELTDRPSATCNVALPMDDGSEVEGEYWEPPPRSIDAQKIADGFAWDSGGNLHDLRYQSNGGRDDRITSHDRSDKRRAFARGNRHNARTWSNSERVLPQHSELENRL